MTFNAVGFFNHSSSTSKETAPGVAIAADFDGSLGAVTATCRGNCSLASLESLPPLSQINGGSLNSLPASLRGLTRMCLRQYQQAQQHPPNTTNAVLRPTIQNMTTPVLLLLASLGPKLASPPTQGQISDACAAYLAW